MGYPFSEVLLFSSSFKLALLGSPRRFAVAQTLIDRLCQSFPCQVGFLNPTSETKQVPNLEKVKEVDYYTYMLLHKGLTREDCIQSVKVKQGLDSSELDMQKAAQGGKTCPWHRG